MLVSNPSFIPGEPEFRWKICMRDEKKIFNKKIFNKKDKISSK